MPDRRIREIIGFPTVHQAAQDATVRSARVVLLVLLLGLLSGCDPEASAAPGNTGRWLGTGVHLVDGTWIGSEHECGSGTPDQEPLCRTVVDRVLAVLAPADRSHVTAARLADLPTTFVTSSGETRQARLGAGINTTEAIVVNLDDGSRRVVGASCHLPYVSGLGNQLSLKAEDAKCWPMTLEWWLDGGAPPSIPPGTKFG